jgi:uncharacterized membrane protein
MKFKQFLLFFIFFLFSIKIISANSKDSEVFGAEVVSILDEETKIETRAGTDFEINYQKLKLKALSDQGREFVVKNEREAGLKLSSFQIGDQVLLQKQGEEFIISDYYRKDALILLSIIFVVSAVIIARKKAFFSILGMLWSFFIIFKFLLPSLLNSSGFFLPVFFSLLAIVLVSFYLSHGFNAKTHLAIVSTLIGILIVIAFACWFVYGTKLSGVDNEEAMFLQASGYTLNMPFLLILGVVISALGVLDDVTIAQIGVVFSLRKHNKNLKVKELYKESMIVGKDHIASMINTLILVYAGSSISLLLLFLDEKKGLLEVLNYELVATEIIKMLVSSLGLVLVVPIATYLASIYAYNSNVD